MCTVDFRPGGVWHYCMKCVDKSQGALYGTEAWGKALYRAIDEPETIAYTDYFSDAEGNEDEALPAAEVTMVFTDLGGQTRLVSRWAYSSAEDLKRVMDRGTLQGLIEMWDRLAERLGVR